jgi:hypothetical protein
MVLPIFGKYTAARTPRPNIGVRRVMAGLLAPRVTVCHQPSQRMLAHVVSGPFGGRLAAYSCGGSRGIDRLNDLTVFPFQPKAARHLEQPSRSM